ncbi:hypothetical protein MTBBW1_1790026 [Desulfamplus magnetovallimortis]|uniref:Cysteine protease StiP N-terminal domain-containing protein n=1 Tax=Desulfamplus magnetovallimortis TaxID=1246637 RepID=A0A1W1HA92_9BACT|nr:cysteine protease StiP domain-containing protein [Desulfamplus magnetovallimortis]SLM29401.1 hypothetical protein MTBBW1_1790026 [Desulfamplus magnetovallimortis]
MSILSNIKNEEIIILNTRKNQGFQPINGLPWKQTFYLNLEEEVHPFNDKERFRPLTKAYTGNNTFWSTPSPEPDLNNTFWCDVENAFVNDNTLKEAAQALAGAINEKYPDPEKILFVSILRAGVPVTDWLCRLLPGSKGVAISLFVGLGIDSVALKQIRKDFPHRSIIFVDGWTGRGGVAKAVASLNSGPLAVLIDPWGWADFSGIQEDIFCPSACFTGLATLGFSRTFFVDNSNFFSAYRFSDIFAQQSMIKKWQSCSPQTHVSPETKNIHRFFAETPLRIHSNEVCRALINASPEMLYFREEKSVVQERFHLLLKLADQRSVPAEFKVQSLVKIKTRVACSLITTA